MKISTVITPAHLSRAMSYAQYVALMNQLVRENRTTGSNQSPSMVEYTQLNWRRMQRLDKTVVLTKEVEEALQQVARRMVWLVLTEAWCGDAAQNLPLIARIAQESAGMIELKLLLRDENPEVMEAYLTDTGGVTLSRSIPKLICLDAQSLEELGTWGPRPAEVQAMVVAHKKNPQGISHEDFIATVHAWYAKDRNEHLQQEMAALLRNWALRQGS